MGIGVAYGIWAASGMALTAVLARLMWRDPLPSTTTAGITIVATGVLLIELGAH
jgi:small multidrug resistance pump